MQLIKPFYLENVRSANVIAVGNLISETSNWSLRVWSVISGNTKTDQALEKSPVSF